MPLSFIKNPVLTITSRTHDGITSRQEIRDFAVKADDLTIQSFRVPENLAQLHFSLSGTVDRLISKEPAHLSSENSVPVNGINATQQLASLFLAKFGADYVLEMRDKSGFPLHGRAVNVGLKHLDFVDAINLDLKTSTDGRIMLGPLADIEQLTTNSAGFQTQTWNMNQSTYRYPTVLQADTKSEVKIPYSPENVNLDVTLLEMHGDSYFADKTDALRVTDGYLVASGLHPGDYLLHIKPNDQRIQIRVTDGEVSPYYIASKTRLFRHRSTDTTPNPVG